jgi:hypothetical protein
VGKVFDPVHGVSWSDGNSEEDLPRGYYPIKSDGSVDTRKRLRWVDDAFGDPDDGSGHFEEMPRDAGVGYFHGAHEHEVDANVVPLEARVKGKPTLGAKIARALKIRYILGGKK